MSKTAEAQERHRVARKQKRKRSRYQSLHADKGISLSTLLAFLAQHDTKLSALQNGQK